MLGDPRFDEDHYQQKVELLVQERVAVVSFTFGCPAPSVVERLQRVGFEVRADLVSGDSAFWVQLTPGQVEALGLVPGSDVWVRPARGAAAIVPAPTAAVAPVLDEALR